MACKEEESTQDSAVSQDNVTLNKIVLLAGERLYEGTAAELVAPQRWATNLHCVDLGPKPADTAEFVSVNRVIAEPWRQCFAVSPVDSSEPEDHLTEEKLTLVQGYMHRPFHNLISRREGADKGPGVLGSGHHWLGLL